MLYTIEETTGSDKVELLWSLFEEHKEEISTYPHLMKLSPKVEMYRKLDEEGALLTLIAYTEDKKPVGYSVNFITNHLHYSELKYASNDLLFVSPEHRKGSLGLRLIALTEKIAQEKGAKLMLWHAKGNTPLTRLLAAKRYIVQDILYSKELR